MAEVDHRSATPACGVMTEGGSNRLWSGWGRTAPSAGLLLAPDATTVGPMMAGAQRAVAADVADPTWRRGLIPRGLGRSYGDAAQCAGGHVVSSEAFDHVGEIGADGTVVVGSGVSIGQLITTVLPAGWFVPVTPGTRQVSIGGAIAADIHGKNHHRDGSFCRHVASLTLVTPTGIRCVSPVEDPGLFWATAGGMGLTGFITEAVLRLTPVETGWMSVTTQCFDDLASAMNEMEQSDEAFRYSVAWVDCLGPRRRLGRCVLTRGDHAPVASLHPGQRRAARRPPTDARLRVGVDGPRGLLNRATMGAFNELWYRRAKRAPRCTLQPLGAFFHPLDGVADWNRLYGRSGFLQYQFVVGSGHRDTVAEAVARIGASGVPSFLAVLKRFGPGNPGLLSFPMAGWTLALDFPLGHPKLEPLLDGLDELVAGVGGRVYLAKDSRLRPDRFAQMYRGLEAFMAVRRSIDPHGLLQSDLAQRLGLMQRASP